MRTGCLVEGGTEAGLGPLVVIRVGGLVERGEVVGLGPLLVVRAGCLGYNNTTIRILSLSVFISILFRQHISRRR